MPIGINSPARNLFLLGSSGAQVVSNFFKLIDQTSATENSYRSSDIKYNEVDKKYLLSGIAKNINVSPNKEFGWLEKRDNAGTTDWNVRIESTESGVNTYLWDMELDSNDNLVVVGQTGSVPWIAKYSNGGVIDWQSTTNTGNLQYFGVTSDSNGQYYASGTTTYNGGSQAFVEKFDANGNPGWGKAAFMLGREVYLEKIAANSRGEVVAVGYLEDNYYYKGYIVKIDTNTGEVLWDRTLSYYGENVFGWDVKIDTKDQIYITGSIGGQYADQFLVKYTGEGNLLWQTQTNTSTITVYPEALTVNDVTESVTTIGRINENSTSKLLISNYDRKGKLIWRRKISQGNIDMGYENIDNEGAFIYFVFKSYVNFSDSKYTYGKLSATGNGLGNFQYNDGDTSTLIDYEYIGSGELQNDVIGKLSDGSVRNDISDFITYPFNANKILFDDLATQVSNKKRQMDSADSFEYSGSPAIRPADFQELNLLGDVYSGSGDWLDQSGKGNDGVVSSPNEPFAGAGGVNFDGTSDTNLTISGTGSIIGTNDFTIEFFIYSDSTADRRVFSLGVNNETGSFVIVKDASGIRINWGVNTSTSGNLTVVGGGWHHVAVVRNSNNIKIYIDGELDKDHGTVSVNFNATTLYIGDDPTLTNYELIGIISNLRVVQSALYTANFTPPTTSLTAISGTQLLTCQGYTIADASANNFTITANGNASPIDEGPTHNAAGYWEFGSNKWIFIGDFGVDYSTNITLEAWIRTTTTTSWNDILAGDAGDIVWAIMSDGKLLFGSQFSTPIPHDDKSNTAVNDGNWHHVMTTYDGANIKHYIDGVLDLTAAETNSLIPGPKNYIGSTGYTDGTSEFFLGDIGEVRLYPRALTAAQVFQNYNATREKYTGVPASTDPGLTSTRTPA